MSETTPDAPTTGITDDQLPEDVRPGEDNPLAEPLDPDAEDTKDADELQVDATADDLGITVESSGDQDNGSDGADA